MPERIETRVAREGEKMIEVRVRFWTNDLAEGPNRVRPKHAWASGASDVHPPLAPQSDHDGLPLSVGTPVSVVLKKHP
jgi:hypothetical protein